MRFSFRVIYRWLSLLGLLGFIACDYLPAQAQPTRSCDLFTLQPPGPRFRGLYAARTSVSEHFAIVGADTDGSSSEPGKAHIYEYAGGSWVLRQTLTAPTAQPGDAFGSNVFIDENTALVADVGFLLPGAPTASRGAVYVYSRQGTQWVQTSRILNPSPDIVLFGSVMAKSGADVVISYPAGNILPFAVHVFRQPALPGQPWTLGCYPDPAGV